MSPNVDEQLREVMKNISSIRKDIADIRSDSVAILSEVRHSGGFGRSVVSNVLANLVAAAILYIGAVVLGYLRSNPVLLATSVVLVVPFLVGVLMVVVGGLRYVSSGGDSGAVAGAKSTILYGMLIPLFAVPGVPGVFVGHQVAHYMGRGPVLAPEIALLLVLTAAIWAYRRVTNKRWVATAILLLLMVFNIGLIAGSV